MLHTIRRLLIRSGGLRLERELPAGLCARDINAPWQGTRWKIENETFNVLKTGGYNLEHSFGHGRQNLAAIVVTCNQLAFAFHTVADITEQVWHQARNMASSRAQFFNNLSSVTSFLIFSS